MIYYIILYYIMIYFIIFYHIILYYIEDALRRRPPPPCFVDRRFGADFFWNEREVSIGRKHVILFFFFPNG